MTLSGCIKITKRTFKKKKEYLSALDHNSKLKLILFKLMTQGNLQPYITKSNRFKKHLLCVVIMFLIDFLNYNYIKSSAMRHFITFVKKSQNSCIYFTISVLMDKLYTISDHLLIILVFSSWQRKIPQQHSIQSDQVHVWYFHTFRNICQLKIYELFN